MPESCRLLLSLKHVFTCKILAEKVIISVTTRPPYYLLDMRKTSDNVKENDLREIMRSLDEDEPQIMKLIEDVKL